jgi:hypothetical protein
MHKELKNDGHYLEYAYSDYYWGEAEVDFEIKPVGDPQPIHSLKELLADFENLLERVYVHQVNEVLSQARKNE